MKMKIVLIAVLVALAPLSAIAQDRASIQTWRERIAQKESPAAPEQFQGREIEIFIPKSLPPVGQRSMVVVLHGGFGAAKQIRRELGMDEVAAKYGFIVAYLNGTKVAARLSDERRGWNAGGGCCGQPAKNNVDDMTYITEAVAYLNNKYGVNPSRVYGMGHSNGAIMSQRLVCEAGLYQAIVPISGPLNVDVAQCPKAKGRKILAVHGEFDENVPIQGGKGTKGFSGVAFNSQAYSKETFEKSGATYSLDIVKNADHKLANIKSAMMKNEGISLPMKAVSFFGLTR